MSSNNLGSIYATTISSEKYFKHIYKLIMLIYI